MSNYVFKFACGTEVECKLTKFRGILVGVTRYLTGCNRYCILPQSLKDGKPQESCWLEEYRLGLVTATPEHGIELGSKAVNFLFSPGDRVEDIVTSFSGIIVAATSCWNSSNRYAVAKSDPKNMKDEREWIYFDESELRLKKAEAVQVSVHTPEIAQQRPGGPALSEAPHV